MPQKRALPTWLALNACDDSSEGGITDLRTGVAQYAGLNLGDYFDLTENEAKAASYSTNGILHAGRYRRIQVDSSATAAYVKAGCIGGMLAGGQPNLNLVTDYNNAISGAHMVVFLNSITPGNYGFVQELGIANILCGTSLQKSGPNTGDLLFATTNGVAQDPTTQSWTQLVIGVALDPPNPSTKVRCALAFPEFQG